ERDEQRAEQLGFQAAALDDGGRSGVVPDFDDRADAAGLVEPERIVGGSGVADAVGGRELDHKAVAAALPPVFGALALAADDARGQAHAAVHGAVFFPQAHAAQHDEHRAQQAVDQVEKRHGEVLRFYRYSRKKRAALRQNSFSTCVSLKPAASRASASLGISCAPAISSAPPMPSKSLPSATRSSPPLSIICRRWRTISSTRLTRWLRSAEASRKAGQ